MRKRIYIPALLALAFLLLALIWWRPTQRTSNSKASLESNFTSYSVTTVLNGNQNSNALTTSQQTASASPSQGAVPINRQNPEAIRQYMESQNVPVQFYGNVVDHDNNPLSGVKITAHVRHWNVIVPVPFGAQGESLPRERETDSAGRFEIHDATGDVLAIDSVTKPGYELEPNTSHSYGVASGSPTAPVVFKMWSTNIHEQLITGSKSFHIVPDGRRYVIDLMNGSISETGGGNLKVWVQRPDQIIYGQKYDWECGIDTINGGLLLANNANASVYQAPSEGYGSSFRYEQKVGSGWGDSTGEKRFYVKLNNGEIFGRITIELFAYYNNTVPGMVRVEYAINPAGSRILR
jgi:hypothetical protein